MSQIIVSLSPHAHGTDSVEKNMYGVVIALLPALLASFYFFGIGSLIVCAASVIACVLFEWLISKFLLQRTPTITDGSAIVTGLLLGMNLPSNFPIWMIVIGALVAIGVGKMTFGGLGQNPFNPALVGRCFLLVSFPVAMTSWPVGNQLMAYTDATTGATPLYLMQMAIKNGDPSLLEKLPSSLDMFLGVIATVFCFSGLLHLSNPVYANPVQVILSGGLMLGAIFMATDYVTSPMCARGQLIYGICIGLLTVIIRNWGAYPEGMSFAILIMNAFTPLINYYVKPKRFGEVPKAVK